MANRLLQRYAGGEYREVWQDLVALGAAVRNGLYYQDAVEVAAETMKRARHNVESIVVKLEKLGYEFTTEEPDQSVRPLMAMVGGTVVPMGSLQEMADQYVKQYTQPGFQPRTGHETAMANMANKLLQMRERMAAMAPQQEQVRAARADRRHSNAQHGALQNPDVFAPASKQAASGLDRFEEDLGGPFPISLRHWYQEVGAVNLMGRHETLNPPAGPHSPDPLVIYPYRDVAEADYGDDLSGRETDVIELTLAPDALHKAHTSGGDPYAIEVPNQAADGLFLWEPHNTTFVNYLRLAFAWGGFPGWEGEQACPRKELDFLKEDLLPV